MSNNRKIFEKLVSKTKVYLIIIAILLVIICILNTNYTIPSIIVFILISLYSYWANTKRKMEISKHIQDLTLTVDEAAKNTLINSPFPLVIIETDGTIIWESAKFVTEFEDFDIKNYLNELVKEIKQEIQNREEQKDKSIERKVVICNKEYNVVGEFVKSKQNERKNKTEYMMMLYFIDETENNKITRQFEDSKICVGIIMVDNYEEVMQRISNEIKPQITAEIDKKIYEWAMPTNGIIVKSDRDTFIYIFEQKYLDEIQKSKFDILDNVKEINIEGIIQITLSIAISNEGNSNYEKYKSASAAMDIVLGRGGDQAVVRRNGKYIFFGGRAEEIEKRTKVKARIVAGALEELITEAKDVMIMGHSNGDMDSMGSSLGIYRLVKSIGKEAYIVNNTFGLTLSSFIEEIKKDEEYDSVFIEKNMAISKISEETLLIVVDTDKKSYVEVPELLEKTNKIVVIDHHRRGTDYIDNAILTFHEVYASSAAELVTELLQYSQKKVKLKTIETEGLYAGIMVDTKNFTFKTGVRTFEAAAYLRKCGIDIIKVKKWFQSDFVNYNLISDIVRKSEIVNKSIAISLYEEVNKEAGLICAKAADELLTISDITASFVIGNLGEKICISGRSIGDINVQIILEKLRRWRTYNTSWSTSGRNDNRRSKTRTYNKNK